MRLARMKAEQIDLFTGKPVRAQRWRGEYEAVLLSPGWQRLKQEAILKHGYKCQRCGRAQGVLELHHLAYDKPLGEEKLSDVKLVCADCHTTEDVERAGRARQMAEAWAEDADHDRRRARWARRTYGEAWKDVPDEILNAEWDEYGNSSGLAGEEGNSYGE
jgi:hypothetical protein